MGAKGSFVDRVQCHFGDTVGTLDPLPKEAGDCPAGGTKRPPVSVIFVLGGGLARRTAKVAVPRVACTSFDKRGMVDEKM
jgi:hypothetical protein